MVDFGEDLAQGSKGVNLRAFVPELMSARGALRTAAKGGTRSARRWAAYSWRPRRLPCRLR